VGVLLALFVASQYGYALRVPFINDDFLFLDKTRDASFVSLWQPNALAFHWYRPWSRELHYWTLQKIFGAHEPPFHVASFALALIALTGFYALTRRMAGGAAAAIATAGAASMAAWGVPMVWAAGVQDLWLLVWSMVFLASVIRGSRRWAAVTLVLALMSKETAVVLPGIAVAYQLLIERRSLRETVRWAVPLGVIVAAWAIFHPVLGGRWWRPIPDPHEPGLNPPFVSVLLRTLGLAFNLDGRPAPEQGWREALVAAAAGAVLLGALALAGGWRLARSRGSEKAPLTAFGMVWAALGWLPLLMPNLGWHAYYGLLGALGAWLAVAVNVARYPVGATVLVVALALLRGARADTPSRDWGSESYQRRAASFLGVMRSDLLDQVPKPSPHTRFYFVRVPSNVGFLAGDGPALRVWYGDPTLRAGYYPAYRPRTSMEPDGPDLFFRYDSTAGWVQIRPGRENVAKAQTANPRWATDHQVLAQTLAGADNWSGALAEYLKVAGADTLNVENAFNVGVCYEALGDTLSAARWYTRAAALPGADEQVRAVARQVQGRLPDARGAGGSRRRNP